MIFKWAILFFTLLSSSLSAQTDSIQVSVPTLQKMRIQQLELKRCQELSIQYTNQIGTLKDQKVHYQSMTILSKRAEALCENERRNLSANVASLQIKLKSVKVRNRIFIASAAFVGLLVGVVITK